MLVKLYKKLAAEMGATVIFDSEYSLVGYFLFQNGNKAFFKTNVFNLNKQASVRISQDKAYTSFFLKQFGYNVPEGRAFFNERLNSKVKQKHTIDDGLTYAQELGFPVILKPNSLSKGRLVSKVFDEADYYRTARKILAADEVFLVQRLYTGNDYRVVVFDGRVYLAYQRIPLTIVGDGHSRLETLLDNYWKNLAQPGRVITAVRDDKLIEANLQRLQVSLHDTPAVGQVIPLMDTANLSSGGMSVDITETIHPEFAALVAKAAQDLGLRLCGVDILASDLTCPPADYVILETNSSPGFTNYAAFGEAHARRVEELFRQLLKAVEQAPI